MRVRPSDLWKFYGRASTELLPAFHDQHLSCANESLRSRLTLREEGQVAGLESPNGLGARAEIVVFAQTSSKKLRQSAGSSRWRAHSPAVTVFAVLHLFAHDHLNARAFAEGPGAAKLTTEI